MGTPRFFLLRHGQSTFNASWGTTRVDPGQIDAPLTSLGHEQVRMVSNRVHSLDLHLVVTSPATRTLQTTLGLFPDSRTRPPIVVEPLVRDRFAGDSCDYGRPPAELQLDFPSLDLGHLHERWWCPDAVKRDQEPIESHEAFAERVAALRSWLASRSEQSILVVGHDGTFRLLSGIRMANCQLLEWDPASTPAVT
jgi:broad specificity phosphatase PhoE